MLADIGKRDLVTILKISYDEKKNLIDHMKLSLSQTYVKFYLILLFI
jgi:hypothetical protein